MADKVVERMDEHQLLDQSSATLMMLKMEEILQILILLIDCRAYYNELTGQGPNCLIYRKLINQIITIAIDEPNPQLNFCSCFFISKLSCNFNNYFSGIKSWLLNSTEVNFLVIFLASLIYQNTSFNRNFSPSS